MTYVQKNFKFDRNFVMSRIFEAISVDSTNRFEWSVHNHRSNLTN